MLKTQRIQRHHLTHLLQIITSSSNLQQRRTPNLFRKRYNPWILSLLQLVFFPILNWSHRKLYSTQTMEAHVGHATVIISNRIHHGCSKLVASVQSFYHDHNQIKQQIYHQHVLEIF